MDMKDKVVVITGAARGLGAAMAEAAAARGATLALVDLKAEMLDDTAAVCDRIGAKTACYGANVALEDDVNRLFADIERDFGRVDGLINNAGITRDGMLVKARKGEIVDKMSLAQWQAVIDVNLTGVFLCGREAAAMMIAKKTKGVIVNISSISRHGNMGQTNYSAAKAGVAAMTVTWAKELARYGIRVASIAPGFIATELVASMKPEALERIRGVIPIGHLGRPDDIAHAAMFIFENDYISGRCIEPDGALRL
ncbi:MAG: SDR family oxidoreductase [Chromatiales bacterium]|nr:SDR family oxidoreductase [Chromatiales bacterium]MDH3931461.1 SDR family oxidoreductase [Chromatiales bacterium]MDH4013228.1 SDR family oxidoreductase [Chromatiales bacterium]PLX57857.1 MAG: 3-oxoacyl-ACP reductase [Chromatiales bacterium]